MNDENRSGVRYPDGPRSLRGSAIDKRRALLSLPHILPLATYASSLRVDDYTYVPDFDPLSGGIGSSVLMLFEKPGPMTVARGSAKHRGSGFISADNDDATAEATFRFMHDAGLRRQESMMWNLIPWWNGTMTVTAFERRAGLVELSNLIALLPQLRCVILVGKTAQIAAPLLTAAKLNVVTSAHPSRRVRNRWPARWAEIPVRWSDAAKFQPLD